MRKIKFRTYINGKMHRVSVLDLWSDNDGDNTFGIWNHDIGDVDEFNVLDYDIMQYTGLKDINGVEVYEGDIVVPAYYMDGMEELRTELEEGVVVWDEHEACFTVKGHEPNTLGCFEEVEVIGNVHEPPKNKVVFDIEEVFPTIREGDIVKVVHITNDQYKSYFEHAIGNEYEVKEVYKSPYLQLVQIGLKLEGVGMTYFSEGELQLIRRGDK